RPMPSALNRVAALSSFQDRPVHCNHCTALLQPCHTSLVAGIVGECLAVYLILGQRGKVDQTEGFVGRSREFGGVEIPNDLASTLADGLQFGLDVFLEIIEFVRINRVTDR